jgi:hypothetical protein
MKIASIVSYRYGNGDLIDKGNGDYEITGTLGDFFRKVPIEEFIYFYPGEFIFTGQLLPSLASSFEANKLGTVTWGEVPDVYSDLPPGALV